MLFLAFLVVFGLKSAFYMVFTDVSYCISMIYYLYFINSRFNFYIRKNSYLCIVIQ